VLPNESDVNPDMYPDSRTTAQYSLPQSGRPQYTVDPFSPQANFEREISLDSDILLNHPVDPQNSLLPESRASINGGTFIGGNVNFELVQRTSGSGECSTNLGMFYQ
jgi:hypothetical protein